MKYELIVRPEAEADIEESFNWYEDQDHGLGHDFRSEVNRCLELIEARPLMYPEVYRGLRRAVMDLFPYSVYFLVRERRIFISACIHQKRHPRVWKSRR